MYTLSWLSLLKMGGSEKERNGYDVLNICGCPGGPDGPRPALIATIVFCIAVVL